MKHDMHRINYICQQSNLKTKQINHNINIHKLVLQEYEAKELDSNNAQNNNYNTILNNSKKKVNF